MAPTRKKMLLQNISCFSLLFVNIRNVIIVRQIQDLANKYSTIINHVHGYYSKYRIVKFNKSKRNRLHF